VMTTEGLRLVDIGNGSPARPRPMQSRKRAL
jgi:hypothetical protein